MIKLERATEEAFMEAIEGPAKCVVNFSAPAWCVPCQRLMPHYEELDETLGGVEFIYIDVDHAQPRLLETLGVKSVPTLMLFKNGQYIKHLTGRTVQSLTLEITAE